ncbi:hypothetical protein [Cupriavidus malaysiensis]|uniref:hypothetical protein n=1 Tax=Cupriavidus malaysiensis TaxID=367825 RepID=UPI000A6119A8|nr:hypothetical protein [Cupriavidus malaysiensis]
MTKERPILFSGAMVRAILDGRKTQTRRIVKPQPELRDGDDCVVQYGGRSFSGPRDYLIGEILPRFGCPYGRPGERLWVRETWQGPMWDGDWDNRPEDAHSPKYCEYAADGGPPPEFMDAEDNLRQGWRP